MPFRFCFLLLALAGFARAMTVEPPTFPELVGGADTIYRGHVTAVQARRVARPDGGGATIKTFVTFAIDRTLKGPAQAEIVLEFLGGRVGDDILEVSGMPQFFPGDRDILFVQGNGRQICPLVRVMHGRYRVAREATTGREYVARDNGQPLNDVAEVSQPLHGNSLAPRAAPNSLSALTPAAFESLISAEVRSPTLQAQAH